MNDRHLFRKIVYLCLIANLLCGCMGAQTGVVATPTIIPTETSTPIPSPTAKPSPTAQSKRALFVLFGQFEEHEYGIPRAILEEAGILVSIASSSLEEVTGSLGSKVQPIVLLSEVKVSDYDAIIFVGAFQYERDNPHAIRIAQEAVKEGKILAAICVAPITLVKAGILNGKKVTTSLSPNIIEQAGGIYSGARVVQDGLIITGSSPVASQEFGEAIAAALIRP